MSSANSDNSNKPKTGFIKRAAQKINSRRYTQRDPYERSTRTDASDKESAVRRSWGRTASNADTSGATNDAARDPGAMDSLVRKFLVISIIFFVGAVSVAGFLFYSGSLTVSGKNVRVAVSGPSQVSAGEKMPLDIVVANNNDLALENARLLITYPDGARRIDEPRQRAEREEIDLGRLNAGEQTRAAVGARLYGAKDATSSIQLQLEYGLDNSNAVLTKTTRHEVRIESAPVSVAVDGPAKVNAGQKNTYEVRIASNAGVPLENVVFRARYPSQFRFLSASPAPDDGETIWRVPTLEPGAEHRILLTGLLEAETDEERTVTFTTGRAESNAPNRIRTVFDESKKTLAVEAPYIGLAVRLSGQPIADAAPTLSQEIPLEVSWRNNLAGRITNAQINTVIGGNAVDFDEIDAGDGFYRSVDKRLVWSPNSVSELRSVPSGQRLSHKATIPTISFDDAVEQRLQNPTISFDVSAAASQSDQADAPGTVSASTQATVKLDTRIGLAQETRYKTGPFTNDGPVPPRVNTETTYTVRLGATSSFNDVRDAELTAVLPPAVTWAGNTSSEAVTYNRSTRTVIWDIGSVRALSGYGRDPRTVLFQLKLTPSIAQLGNPVALLRDMRISGTDVFTGREVSRSIRRGPTTRIIESEGYSGQSGSVQPQ